jgi:hypothetical protein
MKDATKDIAKGYQERREATSKAENNTGWGSKNVQPVDVDDIPAFIIPRHQFSRPIPHADSIAFRAVRAAYLATDRRTPPRADSPIRGVEVAGPSSATTGKEPH